MTSEMEMKVLKGLECCQNGLVCGEGCPYREVCFNGEYAFTHLAKDALELLKDKDQQIADLRKQLKDQVDATRTAEKQIAELQSENRIIRDNNTELDNQRTAFAMKIDDQQHTMNRMKEEVGKLPPVKIYKDTIKDGVTRWLCPTCWYGVDHDATECSRCGQKLIPEKEGNGND